MDDCIFSHWCDGLVMCVVSALRHRDIVLDQVDHIVKVLQLWFCQHHRIEAKLSLVVLDAEMGRSRACFDGKCEEILRVRAVPHQKRALGGLVQHLARFNGCESSPVPA